MASKCRCKICGVDVECGEAICALCELDHPDAPKQCTDGQHCDIRIKEVKPNVWQYRGEDGHYYLKRM